MRFDAVQFAGFDQRADCRPACAAAVTAGEQVVLAAERDRADRALDGIGVEFDAAVMRKRADLPSARARSGSLRRARCGRPRGEAALPARASELVRSA